MTQLTCEGRVGPAEEGGHATGEKAAGASEPVPRPSPPEPRHLLGRARPPPHILSRALPQLAAPLSSGVFSGKLVGGCRN